LNSKFNHLLFESRFESGNLRRATQVGPSYYELILSPDINQQKEHYQWYYFEVSNIVNDIVYTFEILNCLKATSMYSKGMQPLMYSVRDALAGQPGWVRTGESICYYRNLYTPEDCCEIDENAVKKQSVFDFYSIRFNVTFRNRGDVCYFAYHFPYTFSYLKTIISQFLSRVPGSLYYSNDIIGKSLGGNPVHLLTITAPCTTSEIAKKDCIFLCSRVHPGESNASWMMHGILETLLISSDPVVEELRRRFVFKIVPMLNPDGVINGSHRCSLSGEDLNRVWDKPSRIVHPEIYHTKATIQYMCDVLKRPPFAFVDLHGHSRRANVFMFGNNPEESWRADDKVLPHNYEFMKLPEIFEQTSAAFSFNLCQFGITRRKESSARVTVWRQFGVLNAYTMESTFFGFETGAFKGYQIGTKDLKDVGRELLLGILEVQKLIHRPQRQNRSGPRKGFPEREKSVS
uniref:Peptidase_M14 domain-containing protein n=1 Tax=Angiostrongylus cantonensis TaxID=6313 RepID=A0A0K0CXE2_ANGCA